MMSNWYPTPGSVVYTYSKDFSFCKSAHLGSRYPHAGREASVTSTRKTKNAPCDLQHTPSNVYPAALRLLPIFTSVWSIPARPPDKDLIPSDPPSQHNNIRCTWALSISLQNLTIDCCHVGPQSCCPA